MSKKTVNILTLLDSDFQQILKHLDKAPGNIAVLQVIENVMEGKKEFICKSFDFLSPMDLGKYRMEVTTPIVEMGVAEREYAGAGYLPLLLSFCSHSNYMRAKDFFSQVVVEHSPEPHICSGIIYEGSNFSPFHLIKLQGPSTRYIKSPDIKTLPYEIEITGEENERWSRVMGGLGGKDIWKKFVSLNYSIAGLGRNGSLMANSLARMGVKTLSFLDPDIVELHNLDTMDNVIKRDVGKKKTDAIRDNLSYFFDELNIQTVPESVFSDNATELIRKSDFIIACVDNNTARFWINMLAKFYVKPLVDIGSGVFRRGRDLIAGSDIKLVVPGDRCLYCMGCLPDIREILKNLERELRGEKQGETNWQDERAGSLRSINQMGVHMGLRLIENFTGGSQKESIWVRLTASGGIRPEVTVVNEQRRNDCPFCQKSKDN